MTSIQNCGMSWRKHSKKWSGYGKNVPLITSKFIGKVLNENRVSKNASISRISMDVENWRKKKQKQPFMDSRNEIYTVWVKYVSYFKRQSTTTTIIRKKALTNRQNSIQFAQRKSRNTTNTHTNMHYVLYGKKASFSI